RPSAPDAGPDGRTDRPTPGGLRKKAASSSERPIDFFDTFQIFRTAVAAGRNSSAAAEIKPSVLLFDETYQHGTVEFVPVEIAEHARIISARPALRLPDDAERGRLGRPR